MGKIKHYFCTQEHVDLLKGNIRAQDLEEITAGTSIPPNEMLQRGFDYSTLAWAAMRDGKIVCIWGVSSVTTLSETGIPWLIGSDQLKFCDLELGKATCYYVKQMAQLYPRLENFVYFKQKRVIRWLKWAGFKIEEAAPWGAFGNQFHKFSKE